MVIREIAIPDSVSPQLAPTSKKDRKMRIIGEGEGNPSEFLRAHLNGAQCPMNY